MKLFRPFFELNLFRIAEINNNASLIYLFTS
jgi:hypothetical protein